MHEDKYINFEELNEHEERGKDFDIEKVFRKPDLVVIAIHGGKIEAGTTEIARQIAGEELSFYSFMGTKKHKGNSVLHITSDNFDEPECREIVSKHNRVISIHGEKTENEEFIMMGGLDKEFGNKICEVLKDAGFSLKETSVRLRGEGKTNVCNLGNSRKGVQIELSNKLRKSLMSDSTLMRKFTGVIRKVI